jgi:predicted metalloprotease with PDZ domain
MRHSLLPPNPANWKFRWVLLLGLTFSPCYAVTNYTVSLVDHSRHLAEVQIILPEGAPQRELQLPVWNSLYQIRDFSQYVNWVRARDRAGRALGLTQINKSRWHLTGAQEGAIVEYQIFVDSPGAFGAELNSHHAFLNLAQILMYPVDARDSPLTLRFSHVPPGWRVATPMRTENETLEADNYDQAVDSPVEIGDFQESDFDEGGARYRVVVDGQPSDFDIAKITAMLHKIVTAATTWMDDRPFDHYLFIYHFPRGPAGGGMEHAYSTAIAVSADALAKSPEALASVTAHEFFHLWNVKRIRPQTLEPVDYTRENYTRALWFSEGCTSTAADFIQLRAGILNERALEYELAAEISELQRRPAHLTQSAEDSSLNAWLEGDPYYRRPERSISYYNKGELLGVALDLAVREASEGQASLREVFQWMNQNYAKKQQFFPESEGVRRAAEAVSHADLGWFFSRYVSGTEEIPWNDFFRGVGLQLSQSITKVADAGFIASRNFDQSMTVTAVTDGGAAEISGLQVGDIILELNGKPPGQESSEITSELNPGDTITVKVSAHRSGERELKWKIGSRDEIHYELKDLDSVNDGQRARRAAWLKGEAQAPPPGHTN